MHIEKLMTSFLWGNIIAFAMSIPVLRIILLSLKNSYFFLYKNNPSKISDFWKKHFEHEKNSENI